MTTLRFTHGAMPSGADVTPIMNARDSILADLPSAPGTPEPWRALFRDSAADPCRDRKDHRPSWHRWPTCGAGAQEAGVSTPLLDYHFGSRSGLVNAAFELASEEAPSSALRLASDTQRGYAALESALVAERTALAL